MYINTRQQKNAQNSISEEFRHAPAQEGQILGDPGLRRVCSFLKHPGEPRLLHKPDGGIGRP